MAADKSASKQPDSATFSQFVWNSETKQFLGRSGISWLKITVFYIIFYICLAAFWALMLMLFYQTIDLNYPKWQLDASRIGSSPGLGYRPRPAVENIDSTLIKFNSGNEASYKHWVQNLDDFVTRYHKGSNDTIGSGEHYASTSSCEKGDKPPAGKFCPFDVTKIGPECSKSQEFGYKTGKPCVLIKINKIYNWNPQPYAQPPSELTTKAPTTDIEKGVLIECHGDNSADVEKIGPIKYYPSNVIRSVHFPFTNQPGYLPPFVMVQFEGLATGSLINVECRAWAQNIKYDKLERQGSVRFELMLE